MITRYQVLPISRSNNFYAGSLTKKILLLTIITTVILFFGCSKSKENITPSTWAYNDTTCTAVTIRLDDLTGMSILGGTDTKGNYVNIIFNSLPTTNTILNVTNNKLAPGNGSSNCFKWVRYDKRFRFINYKLSRELNS